MCAAVECMHVFVYANVDAPMHIFVSPQPVESVVNALRLSRVWRKSVYIVHACVMLTTTLLITYMYMCTCTPVTVAPRA